jgi:hypothetical protein
MEQKAGEKWAVAVDLQPTIPKSDSLLARGLARMLRSGTYAALTKRIGRGNVFGS